MANANSDTLDALRCVIAWGFKGNPSIVAVDPQGQNRLEIQLADGARWTVSITPSSGGQPSVFETVTDILNEHQRQVRAPEASILKPGVDQLAHHALGLAAEAGEVADQIKKSQFIGRELDLAKILEEMGDTLWYQQWLAGEFGWTLADVAVANIAKLIERYGDGRYTPIGDATFIPVYKYGKTKPVALMPPPRPTR